ncbi:MULTISPECIES: molybdopterin synthase catalytic subunit MoaE [Thalassospira]|uniref:Molybdopterin synthase catalytic subunit n=2 Tax=Thalassospira TaxID=168934 RepID=A0A367WC47_9PROT|nr:MULTISPECIES: molybdopterin synthase catalytic subunit MoaE [Thalassospira]MDG4717493.1 molybdopterin synthase catalytic subunit MoaE [Thalassospira sp. FZY0004]RCK39034.1 molybdenum cofactor biosynthesis protein MoaE [Thalassospira profundimaris]
MSRVSVQQADFDPGAELSALTDGRADIGAAVSFVGLVRDIHGGDQVSALTLDHYPGMTERELEKIAGEAESRWPLDAIRIVHRFGRMLPGERIVLVIVLSAHRRAAFEACDFIMDFLKTRAPFWKREETPDGDDKWVEAKASDDADAHRWT